jgi:hypothetical protein
MRRSSRRSWAGSFIRSAALRLFREEWPEQASHARDHAAQRGLLPWEAERELFGASHLDLARTLGRQCQVPGSMLCGFDEADDPDSLAGFVVRSMAVAARHGYGDPDGAPFPPSRIPEREPILDAYARRIGGPEQMKDRVRSLLVTARVAGA